MSSRRAGVTVPKSDLRRQAESRVASANVPNLGNESVERLVHELQVHQVELQLQNEQLQAALAAKEAADSRAHSLIRSVLDSLRAEIAVLDADGTICAVNESWQRFSVANGVTPGEAAPGTGVGANYLRVCGANIRDSTALEARDGILAVIRGEVPSFTIEYPCHSPHEERWFSLTATPLDTAGGGVVTVHRDITASRRLEEEMRIAAIAFESQQCAMLTDTQGIIVRVNKAFTQLTGYSAEEAMGKRSSLLSSGRHDRAFYEQLWKMLKEAGGWHGEVWNRRKDGRLYVARVNISAVRAPGGATTHYLATYLDMTGQKEAALEIHRLENFDALTGLPNRQSLRSALQSAIRESGHSKRHGALLLLDLDQFMSVNDTLGHAAGDQCLVELAGRLSSRVRDCDTVARNGGDEFAVILPDLGDDALDAGARAGAMAELLRSTIAQPIRLAGEDFRFTASVGIALFCDATDSAESLMKNADLAMHLAKAAGPDCTRHFEAALQTALLERTGLVTDLRRALGAGQLLLHFQPQVDRNGKVLAAEALLRWAHPKRGAVSPAEFIPIAEESGLILPIGAWVLETAAKIVSEWSRDPLMQEIRLAVNVSARQIRQADFVDQVKDILARAGADPKRLKFELTESVVLHDIEDTLQKMAALEALGIGFSLDDFGTGYSSLAYLTQLPLEQLKIDRSFVRNLPLRRNDVVMAQTIIAMARGLGLQVIAEGVETVGQRDFLEQHGCHTYQGYLFSRPLALEQFIAFVHAANSASRQQAPAEGFCPT